MEPRIIGVTDIPKDRDKFGAKSAFSRRVLESLPYDGKALKVEYPSHKDAENARRSLHMASYTKWGQPNNLHIKIDGNCLFVWLSVDVSIPVDAHSILTP